jgi:hypothetical protein
MPKKVRKTEVSIRNAVLEVLRLERRDLLLLAAGRLYHAEATPAPPDLPPAIDLATAITRLNALRDVYAVHLASRCDPDSGFGAHVEVDADNVVAASAATDEPSAITLANELKLRFEDHRASDDFHPQADGVNSIAMPDAADLASLVALTNELYTKVAAHVAASFRHPALELVAP